MTTSSAYAQDSRCALLILHSVKQSWTTRALQNWLADISIREKRNLSLHCRNRTESKAWFFASVRLSSTACSSLMRFHKRKKWRTIDICLVLVANFHCKMNRQMHSSPYAPHWTHPTDSMHIRTYVCTHVLQIDINTASQKSLHRSSSTHFVQVASGLFLL